MEGASEELRIGWSCVGYKSATQEKSAVRPQAAEAAIAALVTATPPAAWISMGISVDIKEYLFGYYIGF